MTENGLHCPECNNNVTKAGSALSGRTRYQQYRCASKDGCGRATMRPLDGEGNKVEALPYIRKERK